MCGEILERSSSSQGREGNVKYVGPVSRKSLNFSGDTIIPFVFSKRKRLETRHFAVIFTFYSLYNLWKDKQNKQVGSFANSFSGPKIFWDFWETGLWFKKIPLVTHAFPYPATKTTREAEWYFYFCMLTGSLSNLRNINSNYKHHFLELFRTGNLIPKKRFFLCLVCCILCHSQAILTRFIKYLDLIFCREHLYQKDIIYTRL